MASPHIIDIDSLLEPISDDQPQGEDIREDRSPTSDYYTIKDARNSARATERGGLFDADARAEALAEWHPVLDKGKEILSQKSKDIEVACWMIEAAVRLHGFTGLRDSLTVLRRLIDEYWDGLYPEPDEDGMETKVAAITGLNGDGNEGTLLTPIRNCAISEDSTIDAFSFFKYQQVYDASKIAEDDKKAERYEEIGLTLEEVERTVSTTADQFYLDLVDDLETCNEEFKLLTEKLSELCGYDAPPSSQISSLLDEVLRTVRFLCQEILARAQAQAESEQATDEVTAESDGNVSVEQVSGHSVTVQHAFVAGGEITNREQALDQLKKIADYFRLYEPQSPLPDGIDRLVRWGRMTVAELMMELMPEENSRGIFSQLTGVAMDGSSTNTYVAPPAPATPAAPAADNTASQETVDESVQNDEGWGGSNETQSNDVGW
ncbi:type VI secretion system protein TssA [Endozoicomonas arenosclerae]|uniref:type VI secretion system protein TssA n=1 Tax=Endozoicomonas arenosclerae TaxID=1633495 RepID=UPI0007815571|nr:type VI secretion system protein TssA [Endozoicomonas arenosclerae]